MSIEKRIWCFATIALTAFGTYKTESMCCVAERTFVWYTPYQHLKRVENSRLALPTQRENASEEEAEVVANGVAANGGV